jgi:hypothetical protein
VDPLNDEPKTSENAIVTTINAVIDDASDLVGGTRGSKIVGGAAVGALAAVVLPVSLLTGAVIGGAYSIWRQSKR